MQYPQQRQLTMAQEELWSLVADASGVNSDEGVPVSYLYCAATGRAVALREGKKLPAVGHRCTGVRSWPTPLVNGPEEVQGVSELMGQMEVQPVQVTIINDTPIAIYVEQVSTGQPFGSLQPKASMVLDRVPSGHRLQVGGKTLLVEGTEGNVQHLLASHAKGRGRKGKGKGRGKGKQPRAEL